MIERFENLPRAEWLMLRGGVLTASDLGAMMGYDRFKSPLQLYVEKTKGLISADNAAMQRGRWLESAVLAAIRERHPDWTVEPYRAFLRDLDLGLGATPDAVRLNDRGEPPTNIQCKVVSRPVYDRDWAKGPPMGYRLQTLCEGMLMGARDSILAALVISTYTADLYMHPVPRDEAAEAHVRAVAAKWKQRIENGKKPPADYARDGALIARMFPLSVPEPVLDLTGDNRMPDLLAAHQTLKAEIALLQQDLLTIDNEIKDKLGEAERAELPGWKISWKTQHRKGYTVQASTSRPLKITRTEAEEEEEEAA